MNIFELTIYTENNILTFDIQPTTDNFIADIQSALENGSVILTTVDDTQLILNNLNCIAVEIKEKIPPI